MAAGKGWFSRLFKRREEEEDDFFAEYQLDMDDEEQSSMGWNWDNLIKDRHLLKLSDDVQREKYIRSLVEQVKGSSEQLDILSEEYNSVTETLRDMDEIEALPESELTDLRKTAEDIIKLEGAANEYAHSKSLMTEAQYKAMERFSDSMPKAYDDIKEAEEHKLLIKDDLKKLDDEKQGFLYRERELSKDIENYRGMMVICLFAAVACVIMLLILQFAFDMNTRIGYIITAFALALTITILYVRFTDAVVDSQKVKKSINRIILLQNTVKIRYVNNKNLLDYLYTKYNTDSSKELLRIWNLFEEERAKREKHAEDEQKMSACQQMYLGKLKKYHLNDVHMWVHNPLAVMNHKEMVELRHGYFLQRQKLRAQMDYNKKLAKEAESELRELIKEYPKYGQEVVNMLERYS